MALLFAIIKANAQLNTHQNFWSRVAIAQPIDEKWKFEVELQHRRQNDFAAKKNNVFEADLLTSVRTWLYYQHKEDIGFAISPFAQYWHNAIIVNAADKQKEQVKEIRFSAAVDLKHELVKKLWLIDRTCFEYRDFLNNQNDIQRLRNRLGVRYEFNNKLNITVFDEVFLNLKGTAPTNFFDHDRLAFLINYKPNKSLRIETGYMHIKRLPRNSDEFLSENNFLMHLYFTLPHSLIHHHTKRQHHS